MLTKEEKELLEEGLDELYEDYERYVKSLKPGEELNATYRTFLSLVKKLGLRHPKGPAPGGTAFAPSTRTRRDSVTGRNRPR